jgi:predicted AlkP superfamily pyrophosphatase or phosphodiesterase
MLPTLGHRALQLVFPFAALALASCHPGFSPTPDPAAAASSSSSSSSSSDAPLVILVVVDQLRADLLDRYDDAFDGGLARLRDQGLRFRNAVYDHAATETAAGHSTASTGTHPARHGVVANTWRERIDGESWTTVYSFADPVSPVLGHEDLSGRSPANLRRGGLADWLLAHDPTATVVSISAKDRAAIPLAGRSRSHVYWMPPQVGQFVTSGFYRDEYPDWVVRFNAERLPQVILPADSIWESTVPDWALPLARGDTARFEGDGQNTYFPHRFHDESDDHTVEGLHTWRSRTPLPDAALVEFAITAIDELRLGRRGTVDLLALSFSQSDFIGHDYGPFSREQFDNLIRLDRELGRLLDHLDRRVGEGNWVLGLTADHGVLEMPEYRAEIGLPGRRVPPRERAVMVRVAESAADEAGEDPVSRARAAAAVALETDWVADAFAWADLLGTQPADTLRALYTNSYFDGRAIGPLGHLGVQIRMEEGILVRGPTGTTHGSPYLYDRHVPFIIMGKGIPPGVSDHRTSVVDLAPTLAHLAGIPAPGDLDGVPVPLPRVR